MKTIALIIATSSLYGFSIGLVHSLEFALRNLIKFPLLILVTTGTCSMADYLIAKAFSTRLDFVTVQRCILGIFKDLTVMLASLSPVMVFLARTIERPDEAGLNEYPMFLGLNVGLIAVCGIFAVIRQTRGVANTAGFSPRRGAGLILCWMTVALFVGAQWAWYLRPFCGVASLKEKTPFFLGTRPDFRGATSFYEAVFQLFDPPSRGTIVDSKSR